MKTIPKISTFISAIAFLAAGCKTPTPYNPQPATTSSPEQRAIPEPTVSPAEQAYDEACRINTVGRFDKFISTFPDEALASKARSSAYTIIDQYSTGTANAYLREHRSSAFQQHDDAMARSRNAGGALEVAQAGNELSGLGVKQSLQLQSLLAAQARAETVRRARDLAAENEARQRFKTFLGTGPAYAAGP